MQTDLDERQVIPWRLITVVTGVAAVLVGAGWLVHRLWTPAGLVSLFGVAVLAFPVLFNKRKAAMLIGLVLLLGIGLFPGFLPALINQKTQEARVKVQPILQQMKQADQKLITHPSPAPLAIDDPYRPMYLVSPNVIKEGWQPPR